jgi:succinate-acetate transporter protein
MTETHLIILNFFASIIIIICSVLSINLISGLPRELKGLKGIDQIWKNFIFMTILFILLGVIRAAETIGIVIFPGAEPILDAFISVILILFFVFAVLLGNSIQEMNE